MSSDKRNISVNDYEMNIDLYSILRDIWKYAIVILLLAASMSLLSLMFMSDETITNSMNQQVHLS